MTESDIVHENGDFWVARDKAGKVPAYVVYRVNGTHSVSDSAYERSPDGLSIAIARCDYLARRAAPVRAGAVYWSDLARYLNANAPRLPGAVYRAVKAEALARYRARMAQGRADSPLDFRDLVERCESAISGGVIPA